MKQVLQIIDSIDYIRANCFQHQLYDTLHGDPRVSTTSVSYNDLTRIDVERFDVVLSCLKQRTLVQNCGALSHVLKNSNIIVYDQDPWESFRDGSQYKGSYHKISETLNVAYYAVTTRWWANYLNENGFRSKFVKMWIKPEYCSSSPEYVTRDIDIGFIGTLHGHRKNFNIELEKMGIKVSVFNRENNYDSFLNRLSTFKTFLHHESYEFTIDGEPTNLDVGLWIKDIEAIARGCISIRNRGADFDSYFEGIPALFLYDSVLDVPEILSHIEKLDYQVRQELITRSVEVIRNTNKWSEFVTTLCDL